MFGMFGTVSSTAIISLVLIILVHSLYNFLKTNLTIPKIKDLVNKPDIGYKEIYQTIQKQNNSGKDNNDDNMKNELKKYLQTLSKKKQKPNNPLPTGSSVGPTQFNNYQVF